MGRLQFGSLSRVPKDLRKFATWMNGWCFFHVAFAEDWVFLHYIKIIVRWYNVCVYIYIHIWIAYLIIISISATPLICVKKSLDFFHIVPYEITSKEAICIIILYIYIVFILFTYDESYCSEFVTLWALTGRVGGLSQSCWCLAVGAWCDISNHSWSLMSPNGWYKSTWRIIPVTPWKINGWNLQITHLEHVNLQGCSK